MAKNYYDITLALAGVHQAALLVQHLAHKGQCNTTDLATLLNSVIITNPSTTLEVYGKESNLKSGLEVLLSLFGNNQLQHQQSHELIRYTMSQLILGRKLLANSHALNQLSLRINQLNRQLTHFDILSNNIIGAMADIYVDVISPLCPRIQILGSADILTQSAIQSKIRAALLGGIRSAVLWRQVGGKQIQLLLSRRRSFEQAKQILLNC